jgi:hypothetical protein
VKDGLASVESNLLSTEDLCWLLKYEPIEENDYCEFWKRPKIEIYVDPTDCNSVYSTAQRVTIQANIMHQRLHMRIRDSTPLECPRRIFRRTFVSPLIIVIAICVAIHWDLYKVLILRRTQ